MVVVQKLTGSREKNIHYFAGSTTSARAQVFLSQRARQVRPIWTEMWHSRIGAARHICRHVDQVRWQATKPLQWLRQKPLCIWIASYSMQIRDSGLKFFFSLALKRQDPPFMDQTIPRADFQDRRILLNISNTIGSPSNGRGGKSRCFKMPRYLQLLVNRHLQTHTENTAYIGASVQDPMI